MQQKIKILATKHKELGVYIFLNYFDKFVAFCLPLSVLYISKDQQAYNDIEYIFSIANIAVVLLEFGLRTYFFYGYKISHNRELFVKQVKGYFDILFCFYAGLGIVLIPLIIFYNSSFQLLFLFIVIRSLFLLFTGFHNIYFRLIDKPSSIFWYTIPVNLLSIIAIVLISISKIGHTLFAFFIPEGILIILVIIKSRNITLHKIKALLEYLKIALSYSWPIILNSLFISYINNYAKIYTYNNMSPDEMFQLSFLLRISLIIQMMHISISGYYSKQLFIDTTHGINKKIFLFYLFFLSLAVLMVFVFILILNLLPAIAPVKINITTFIIIIYTLIWCIQAFLELYLSKYNKPKMILVFSGFSTVLYISLIFSGNIDNIFKLSLIMLSAISFNLLLTMGYLRFNLFKRKK